MKPVVRNLALATLAGLLLLGLALAVLLFTGPGLKLLVRAAPLAGVELRYAALEGSLARFEAEELALSVAGTTVEIAQFSLNWRPLALLQRQLDLDTLSARQVRVELPAPDPDASVSEPLDLRQGIELPLRISVAALQVSDLSIERSGEPLVSLDQVSVTGVALGPEQWRAETLEASTEAWQLAAAATLSPGPDLSHDLSLQFRLNDDRLIATANGDAEVTTVDATLNGQQVALQARIADWTRSPEWQIDIRVSEFQGLQAASLNGSGNLQAAEGSARIATEDRIVDVSQWKISRAGETWRVELNALTDPWRANVVAELDSNQVHDAQVILQGQSIESPDAGLPVTRISLSGPFEQLSVRAQSRLPPTSPVGAADIDLAATVSEFSTIRIDQLDARILDGSATGGGQVQLAAPLSARLDLALDSINLSALDSRLPRAISGTLTARSSSPDSVVETSIVLDLRAQTPTVPVTVAGSATLLGANLDQGQFTLSAGADNSARLELLGPDAFTLEARLGRLPDLWPDAAGELTVDLTLRPGDPWPALNGTLEGRNLGLAGVAAIDTLEGRFLPDSVVLAAQGVKMGERELSDARITVSGDPANHEFGVSANHAAAQLALSGRGGLQDSVYRFDLGELSAELPLQQRLTLARPVSGVIAPDQVQIGETCLDGAGLLLCVGLDQQPQSRRLDLHAHSDDLATLPWRELQGDAQTRIIPEGQLDLELTVLVSADAAALDGSLSLDRLRIEEPGGEGLVVRELSASVTGDQDAALVQLQATLPDGQLRVAGSLEDLLDEPSAEVTLLASLNDVSVLSIFAPQIEFERGAANAELQLRGPLAHPAISGETRLTGLQATLPQLGISPLIDLTMQLPESGEGRFEGTVSSGGGTATLAGTASWDGALNLSGALVGSELLVADGENLSVAASPNLRIEASGPLTRVSGKVVVDRGHVALARSASGPSASADVVIVDQQQSGPDAEPSQVELDVRVELAQPLQIAGYGLTGQIDGGLTVRQRPSEPMLANGTLNLTGQYAAFGQKLSIDEGRLIYVNTPLDNPAIELYASREVEDATIGVRVTGRANSLSAALESNPPMSESDQLSLLVLGRRPGALDEAQSDQLAAAAVSLALSQGNRALGGLGGSMSNVSLTQELGGLALAIGKQLSPRLYVGYTVDLLKPIQLVKLRYRITDSWTAETELGLESRGAIRYRRER